MINCINDIKTACLDLQDSLNALHLHYPLAAQKLQTLRQTLEVIVLRCGPSIKLTDERKKFEQLKTDLAREISNIQLEIKKHLEKAAKTSRDLFTDTNALVSQWWDGNQKDPIETAEALCAFIRNFCETLKEQSTNNPQALVEMSQEQTAFLANLSKLRQNDYLEYKKGLAQFKESSVKLKRELVDPSSSHNLTKEVRILIDQDYLVGKFRMELDASKRSIESLIDGLISQAENDLETRTDFTVAKNEFLQQQTRITQDIDRYNQVVGHLTKRIELITQNADIEAATNQLRQKLKTILDQFVEFRSNYPVNDSSDAKYFLDLLRKEINETCYILGLDTNTLKSGEVKKLKNRLEEHFLGNHLITAAETQVMVDKLFTNSVSTKPAAIAQQYAKIHHVLAILQDRPLQSLFQFFSWNHQVEQFDRYYKDAILRCRQELATKKAALEAQYALLTGSSKFYPGWYQETNESIIADFDRQLTSLTAAYEQGTAAVSAELASLQHPEPSSPGQKIYNKCRRAQERWLVLNEDLARIHRVHRGERTIVEVFVSEANAQLQKMSKVYVERKIKILEELESTIKKAESALYTSVAYEDKDIINQFAEIAERKVKFYLDESIRRPLGDYEKEANNDIDTLYKKIISPVRQKLIIKYETIQNSLSKENSDLNRRSYEEANPFISLLKSNIERTDAFIASYKRTYHELSDYRKVDINFKAIEENLAKQGSDIQRHLNESNQLARCADEIERRLKSEGYQLSLKIIAQINEEIQRLAQKYLARNNSKHPEYRQDTHYDQVASRPELLNELSLQTPDATAKKIAIDKIDPRIYKLISIRNAFENLNKRHIAINLGAVPSHRYPCELYETIYDQLANDKMEELSDGKRNRLYQFIRSWIIKPIYSLYRFFRSNHAHLWTPWATQSEKKMVLLGRALLGYELVSIDEANLPLRLNEIPISENTSFAYLRSGNRLHYFDRFAQSLTEIKNVNTEKFDQELKPTTKARSLTPEELKTIHQLTGHQRLFQGAELERETRKRNEVRTALAMTAH